MSKQDNSRFRSSPRRNPGDGGISLQTTFGLPPDNLEPRTNEMIKKSMPVARFFPSVPEFQKGLDLFHIKNAWTEYTDLLKDNGFSTPNSKNDGIQIAFLADNFPTDSFTNEYGENFLQKMTGMASEGASSLAQIMGADSASEAYKNMQGNLAKSEGNIGKIVAGVMGTGADVAGMIKKALQSIPAIGGAAGSGVDLIDKLAAGSRIDFPMVWKSSGFQPSYSLTCRLYNPYPQSREATERFIIGPIAAILLMGVPRSNSSATYTWPFLHRIECKGIYELNPGFISNITVIKGGDQQQISFQQRLGIVDVRIDIGSLYSSMMGGYKKVSSQRPTVYDYATALAGEEEITTREGDNENVGTGSYKEITGNRNVGLKDFGTEALSGNVNLGLRKSPKRAAKAEGVVNTAVSRVSAAAESVYDELKDLNPFG